VGTGKTKDKDKLMSFKKNDFVRHPSKPKWGVGIVVSDQRGERVSVYFENKSKITTLILANINLEIVSDPAQSRLYLENIITGDTRNGVTDQKPFPEIVEEFINRFSGGLYGQVLERFERKYKDEAHEKFITLLSKSEFQKLVEAEQWAVLAERIKKCHTINMLSKFELIRFSDVLREPDAQKAIGEGLFDLLYGGDSMQKRFMRYAKVLEGYDCNKWPIITLPLFFCFPEEHMFIKPTMTQEAAENRRFDIQYNSHLNWNTYSHVLLFAKDLYERMSADNNTQLHPRDMIDVQTFMWCTFAGGWGTEEIKKAEAELQSQNK